MSTKRFCDSCNNEIRDATRSYRLEAYKIIEADACSAVCFKNLVERLLYTAREIARIEKNG
jgi:hypothetical protein